MSTASAYSLLVVDDEPDLRTLYELTLLREGYDIETAGSVEEAWEQLQSRSFGAVITDMRLPDGSGLDLLRRLDESRREKTIVITAYGSAQSAVEALKAGAYDYLTKPVDLKLFRSVVASALGRSAPSGPTVQLDQLPSGDGTPSPLRTPGGRTVTVVVKPGPSALASAAAGSLASSVASSALARMAGDSAAMRQVRALVERVARSMAPVLVQGESGTGKELVARAIHDVSARSAQPFIAVNCGAIPEQLLEAEFFGYRKGAFTGASEDRDGFFQAARGGTLFLDEIGDLPLSMQSKLLRAIQERSVRPVGATQELPMDVRIVSATHMNLAADVQAGRFRQDLFYRLNVIQIRVPALRERLEDLPAISERVLDRIACEAGVGPPPRLTAQALDYLTRYPFGGNVRELENLLHRAVALSDSDLLDVQDLHLPEAAFAEGARSEAARAEVDAGGAGASQAPEGRGAAALARTPSPVAASVTTDRAVAPAGLDHAGAFALPDRVVTPAALPEDLAAHLDEVERDILVRALERYRCNRTAAGASLGLSLRQMRYRMARLGVNVADHAPTVERAPVTDAAESSVPGQPSL